MNSSPQLETDVSLLRPPASERAETLAVAGEAHCDLTGKLIFVNDRFCEMVGYSRAALLQMHMQDIIYPKGLPRSQELFRHLVETGEPFGISNRYVRRDGAIIWGSISVVLIRDASGQALHTQALLLDITAQQQTEAQLRLSEEKYYTLFNSIDEGFCVIELLFDAAGTPCDYLHLEVNRAFEAQTGLQNATGKRVRELLPKVEQHWIETYAEVVRTGQATRFVNYSEGLQSWYDVYAFRLGDKTSRQVGLLFRNITEPTRTARALRESEERLRLATRAADMFSWELDLASRQLHLSDNAAQVLGFVPTNQFDEAVASVHAEDRKAVSQTFAQMFAAGGDGKVELRVRHPVTGQDVWTASAGVTVSDATGAAARLVGITQNITERKHAEEALRRSEERLQMAIQAGGMYWWEIDAATRRMTFAENALRVLHDESLPQTTKEGMATIHPDDRVRITAQLRHAIETGEPFTVELRYVNTQGELIWLESHGAVIKATTGAVARVIGISQDITARKHAEAALQCAHDDLLVQVNERRAAEAQVKELVRRVVTAQESERQRISRELHDEMGQRLSALSLEVKALQDCAECPPQAAAHLARLKASIAALEWQVDRLALELHPPVLNNLGVVEALRQYAENWTTMSRVPVDFQTIGLAQDRFPLEAETALYRIAQEALTNILKHAQATQVGLIVEQRRSEMRLIIEDNGSGFVPETLQNAPNAQYKTGLRGMQERLATVNGTLTIETAPGQGTTIYACIPVGVKTETDA